MGAINYLLRRLAEPSSAAGISGVASGVMVMQSGQWQAGILAVMTGIAAVLIPDKRG